MSTSVIPAVIDALVELATDALPDALVYDGYAVSGATGDVLWIGVDDPEQDDMSSSAETTQAAATMGTNRSRDEDGTITCAAMSSSGEGDMKAARDGAFAVAAAVETIARTTDTPGLGVAGVYKAGVTAHRLLQGQDETGAVAIVIFQLAFLARL